MDARLPLLILAAAMADAPPVADGVDPAERVTHMRLRTLDAVLCTYKEATGSFPESGPKLRPVDTALRTQIEEPYGSHLPERDGWGNPLFFHVQDNQLLLISPGPNGRVDDTAAWLQLHAEPVGSAYRAKKIDGDDVAMLGGRIVKRSPGHLARQKITVAVMRSLGTALESYRSDHGVLPEPRGRFATPFEFSTALEPTYIKEVPGRDAWDTEFLVWCGREKYVVISLGADREPDLPYREVAHPLQLEFLGPFSSPKSDIILMDGHFAAYPEGFSF